jgi:tRNA (cmo5U34)-methyltransferase
MEDAMAKSTVQQIRERFDKDVERFSNLETGQAATVDAPLCMELVTRAASVVTPGARDMLDIGCGAGNYTVKMLQRLPGMNCTLVDLSEPMLARAKERVGAATAGAVTAVQGDMREIEFGDERFDVVVATAALHHLRSDAEWEGMFAKIFRALRRGGSFWVFDMVEHEMSGVEAMMRERYGEYLAQLKGGGEAGAAYQEAVFAYVEAEDTPRSLGFQMKLMERVGFVNVEVLHKNGLFAAFGGRKEG